MPATHKIVVKVGKRSNLKFRNTDTMRAVTILELESIVSKNPDISAVIIENIHTKESERLKGFIEAFEKERGANALFFYVPDNDDVTCGLADELAHDIYLNVNDLYRAIKIKCGIDVSINFDTLKSADDSFDDSFDDTFISSVENDVTDSEMIEVLPTIDSKDDIDEFDDSGIDSDDNNEEKDESADVEQDKIAEYLEEIGQLKKQLADAFERQKALSNLASAIKDEKKALEDRLELYSNAVVIEDPISLVEYQDLQRKLQQLSESNGTSEAVAEEVDKLKQELANAENSKDEIEQQLNLYKSRLKESASKLSLANQSIDEYKTKVDELQVQLNELKSATESAESTQLQRYNEEIARLKNEISAYESKMLECENNLTVAYEQIKKLEQIQQDLIDRIEKEAKGRVFLIGMLEKAVKEIQSISMHIQYEIDKQTELKERIAFLEDENSKERAKIVDAESRLRQLQSSETVIQQLQNEKEGLEDTINSQVELIGKLNQTAIDDKKRITELESKLIDTDSRIELVKKDIETELISTKQELLQEKAKNDIISGQLIAKENQYSALIQSVGMDESGVNTLLENTRAVEEINKTLREQIVALKEDLDRANRDRQFAQQTVSSLEEANKNMRVSLKAMSGIGSGLPGSSSIPAITYIGKGMIIPVFGCGSFGITTTAMSIANKLAVQYKVLYIDFDMVTPKADGWLMENPIIKGAPEIEPNNPRATGLGLLVDKQIQYFMTNISLMIKKPVQTKNGCIDYISGFYTKPDMVKLISTDFSAFINYCGNSYSYVIIDFGRYGSSDINDQIIKAFSDIAYRNVVVTTNDKFEIRTFRMKLGEGRINMANVAWLVNMCQTTNIDDKSKAAISPAEYALMPFDSDIHGTKRDFLKDRLTRDKFALFMDKAIFRS